jgi:hypothetical protein
MFDPSGDEAGIYRLKLQHLQNKVLRTSGSIPMCIPAGDLQRFPTLRTCTIIKQNCAGNKVLQNHDEYICSIKTQWSKAEKIKVA